MTLAFTLLILLSMSSVTSLGYDDFMKSLRSKLSSSLKNTEHPQQPILIDVLASRTSLSSSQFPYISQPQFHAVLDGVPHLFQAGERLLRWLSAAEKEMSKAKGFSAEERESVDRAIRVLRNIVYSAGICAPSDLWVLRHVLSAHAGCGINELWLSGDSFSVEEIAADKKLDEQRLHWDLDLLHCRGYLSVRNRKYRIADNKQAQEVFRKAMVLPRDFQKDMTESLR